MKKKKHPLTPREASFVLHGMLSTIDRIGEEIPFASSHRMKLLKVKSEIHGLIYILKNPKDA